MDILTGGELFDRILAINHFKEADASRLTYLLVSTLKYMHDLGIVHRYNSFLFHLLP